MREHLNGSEQFCICVSFCFASLSQCLERYREDENVPAEMLTPINRQVYLSFVLHSFCDFVCYTADREMQRDDHTRNHLNTSDIVLFLRFPFFFAGCCVRRSRLPL